MQKVPRLSLDEFRAKASQRPRALDLEEVLAQRQRGEKELVDFLKVVIKRVHDMRKFRSARSDELCLHGLKILLRLHREKIIDVDNKLPKADQKPAAAIEVDNNRPRLTKFKNLKPRTNQRVIDL